MVIDFFLLVEYNFYYGINGMRSTVVFNILCRDTF